jgi:hypothetical protein
MKRREFALFASALAASAGLVQAAPVTPVIKNDLAFGLSRGTATQSTDLVRNGVSTGSQWNAQFVQSMEFDNLDGIRHNPRGNLLGMSFGTTAGGLTIFSQETAGTGSDPGAVTQIFDFASYATNNPSFPITLSRGGGLSVSPDNTRIAFTGSDSTAVYVLNYSAGNGTGNAGTLSQGRELPLVLRANSTQGTTWLNNSSFLVFDGNGNIQRIDDSGSALTNTTVATVGIPSTFGNPFTSLAYEPTVSPFVYASVSQFTGSGGTPPNTTFNKLYVLDPANSFNLVATRDYSTSIQTAREIHFDSKGNLLVSQFGSGTINASIDRIDNAVNVAGLTDNVSTDFYTAGFTASFSGHDVALGHIDYVNAGVNVDVRGNGYVTEYFGASPISTVRSKIVSGYAGGSWNGTGIRSSVAATTPGTGVGYADVASGTFFGETVTQPSVVVGLTLLGDANLDRVVDIGDFSTLAANFNVVGDWVQGDFDYSGTVGIGDFSLLAANFNRTFPGSLPRGAAVPEPAALSLLALGAASLLRRRRD